MWLLASSALAKPKVALVAFEGDANGTISEVLADLLDGDYAVAGSRQVSRTLDKLGLDTELSEKDLRKLANELEVDAIIRGDLSKSGKRKLLHVKLFVNGKKVRGFKVEFASHKSAKFKSMLKDKMDEKLAIEPKKKRSEPAESAFDDEDPVGGKKRTKKSSAFDRDETRADRDDEDSESRDRRDDDEDSDDEDRPRKRTSAAIDDEEIGVGSRVELGSKSSSGRNANVLAVRLDVGPSVSSRRLVFNSREFEEAPKPYENNPVGGMRVGGELYPFSFINPHGILAGIGFAGHYDQTLKLNLQSTAQPGTKFPVAQKHWSVGARIRIAFGRSARAPTVTLGGGYFHRVFKVDRSLLMEGNIIDLPDVFYRGFDPGLEFRIPIIKQLAFVAGGQALLVTNTGQIQQLYSYGQAKVTAGQAHAGLDIVIANRVALRLSGEYAQFGYDFTGNGEQTYNRDNDPSTPDVGGASDRFVGGSATLAVLY